MRGKRLVNDEDYSAEVMVELHDGRTESVTSDVRFFALNFRKDMVRYYYKEQLTICVGLERSAFLSASAVMDLFYIIRRETHDAVKTKGC